jgi:phage shock protein PspC (stress-responsive transcriptional regulator)
VGAVQGPLRGVTDAAQWVARRSINGMTSDLPPTGGTQPPPESTPDPFGSSAPTAPRPDPTAPPVPPDPPDPPAGTSAGPRPSHGIDDFFDRIRSLGVSRPDNGRWGAGVAAGLARRWDIDVVLIRGLFVALTLFGGIGVVAYGLAWLFLPQDDGRIHLQQAIRGDFSAGFFGAALVSLVAISGGGGGPWHHGFWFDWGFPGGLVFTVALIAGIWWLARTMSSSSTPGSARPGSAATGPTTTSTTTSATGYSTPPGYSTAPGYAYPATTGLPTTYGTPPPYGTPGSPGPAGYHGPSGPSGPSPAAGWPAPDGTSSRSARDRAREQSAPSKAIIRLTLGIALLAAAAVLVLGHQRDWAAPMGVIAAATALGVVAAGVIASGLAGRRAASLVLVGILLAIGTLAGAGANNVGIRADQNLAVVGSQEWRPSTADRAGTQYNLGVGEATLWLTDPAILAEATPQRPLRVSARVGAGHLTVVLPKAVPARIEIQIGAGEVVYPDGSTVQVDDNKGDRVQNLNTGPDARARLIVTVQQGVGQLELKTVGATSEPAPTPTASSPTPTATASSARPTAKAPAVPTPTATN